MKGRVVFWREGEEKMNMFLQVKMMVGPEKI
jgi:hypothetical protein